MMVLSALRFVVPQLGLIFSSEAHADELDEVVERKRTARELKETAADGQVAQIDRE